MIRAAKRWIRRKIVGVAVTASSSILIFQLMLLPWWLDGVTGAVQVGLLWVVARLHESP